MEAPAPVMGTAIRYPVRFSVAYAEKALFRALGSGKTGADIRRGGAAPLLRRESGTGIRWAI